MTKFPGLQTPEQKTWVIEENTVLVVLLKKGWVIEENTVLLVLFANT